METLEEKYKNLQLSSLNVIRSYTCMLLTDISKYKVYGTGIFIQIQDNYFLISAAHVFDNYEKLFIPLGKDKEIIKPGGITYNNSSINRAKDSVDIGFMKLDKDCVSHLLGTYNFLQADDLAINHTFENQEYYTFVGYPSTRSKISWNSDVFEVGTFFHFSTPEKNEYYSKFDRNPIVNVVTSYNRKRSYNTKQNVFANGPDLHGISGCGLWFTDPLDLFTGRIKPKLTAIMTDWPIGNRTRIIGTRIDVITESIRKYLNVDFPESKILRVK
mgnify:CR=1 FL=1